MRQIIAGRHTFEYKVVSGEEARQVFKDQPYKLELIEGLEKGASTNMANPLAEKRRFLSILTTSLWIMSWAARGEHQPDQPLGDQTDERGRGVLARR